MPCSEPMVLLRGRFTLGNIPNNLLPGFDKLSPFGEEGAMWWSRIFMRQRAHHAILSSRRVEDGDDLPAEAPSEVEGAKAGVGKFSEHFCTPCHCGGMPRRA